MCWGDEEAIMEAWDGMRKSGCISFDEVPPLQYADGSVEVRGREYHPWAGIA